MTGAPTTPSGPIPSTATTMCGYQVTRPEFNSKKPNAWETYVCRQLTSEELTATGQIKEGGLAYCCPPSSK